MLVCKLCGMRFLQHEILAAEAHVRSAHPEVLTELGCKLRGEELPDSEALTYTEFRDREETASNAELERLSRLPAFELIQRIERGQFGEHNQAFAALAATRDVRLAGPFLAEQLTRHRPYAQRLSCAYALLSLLPYSGIPAHALADPRHPGHGIYTTDLQAHLDATLKRLKEDPVSR